MSRMNGLSFWGPGNTLAAAIHLAYTNPNPLTVGSATPTFTRATQAWDIEDVDARQRVIPSGARPVHGMRVVRNLYTSDTSSIAVSGNKTVTVAAGTYIFSMGAGSGTITFTGTATGSSGTLDADATDRTFKTLTITSDGTIIATASTAECVDVQLEDVTGAVDQRPSEYVSYGVLSAPYHGAAADGFKYFNTFKNVTVDGSTYTVGTGAAITDSNAKFAVLQNQSTDYYSQSDSADNSFTTDIAGWVYVAAEDYTSGAQDLIRKWGTSGNRSYILRIESSGRPTLYLSDSGSNIISTTADADLPFSDGEGGWIGWFRDDSENTIDYYTAKLSPTATLAELDGAKAQLGTAGLTLTSTGIYDSTADLTVGPDVLGGGQFIGRVYRAYLGETLAAADVTFDANDVSGWTENGNAYIYTPPVNADGPLGYRPWASVENLFTYSEDFTNAVWDRDSDATVTGNQTVAPDGTTTADVLSDNSGGGTAAVSVLTALNGLSVTSGNDVTVCVWAKAKQLNWMAITSANFDAAGNGITYFNLATAATGTVSSNHTAHVEQYPDGWVRCGITFSSTTDLQGQIIFYLADGDGDVTVDRDGTSDIYIWGAMAADGWSVMPPYVATEGSTVTRNADVETWDVSGISGIDGPVTLLLAGQGNWDNGQRLVGLNDGSATNEYFIGTVSNKAQILMRDGTIQANIFDGTTLTDGTGYTLTGAFDTNDVEAYLDGSTDGTPDTSGTLPSGITQLNVGSTPASGSQPNGIYIQSVKVFTSRLTDAQVAAEAS